MATQNADFQKRLHEFKIRLDKVLEKELNIVISDIGKHHPIIKDSLEYAKFIIMSGGKRLRGSLLFHAYQAAGGKNKQKIMKAAAAAEVGHLFVLMHDDIIDHGTLRHNVKTLNNRYSEKKYSKNLGLAALHFGDSIALIIGDMLYALMNKLILESDFDKGAVIRGLIQLHKVSITTAVGQIQDIAIGQGEKITTNDVLDMYKNKTARYTIEGPLQIGMIIAGCQDKKILNQVKKYAIPIGIAFQIQDDILGIFGDKARLGKSVASDIEEEKNTLLLVRARELASTKQRNDLKSILGKKNITKKEILKFKNIIIETGALEYAKGMVASYLIESKKQINNSLAPKELKEFLLNFIDYLKNRDL